MSGTALIYDLSGFARLEDRLQRLAHLQRRPLLGAIGAVAETQTKRRLQDEKESPAGEPWANWSERYARTRHSGHSLLMNEGDLDDSITHFVHLDGSAVEVGSNLIYAATEQFGDADRNIPARPFLGLSADNEEELLDVVDNFLDRVVNL